MIMNVISNKSRTQCCIYPAKEGFPDNLFDSGCRVLFQGNAPDAHRYSFNSMMQVIEVEDFLQSLQTTYEEEREPGKAWKSTKYFNKYDNVNDPKYPTT